MEVASRYINRFDKSQFGECVLPKRYALRYRVMPSSLVDC